MKKVRYLLCIIALMTFLPFVATPCPARAAEPIKIGAILDFTGPAAMLGPLFKDGIVMALEENKNQVAGRPIDLIAEDTAGDPAVSLEKARKLVERDKVNIIIGPLMGDAHFAIDPYVATKKVLITTLYCGDLSLTKSKRWLIYPTTLVGLTIPLGWYAYDAGYRTMDMITSDYAGGHGFMRGVRMGFEQKGGKITQEILVPIGTADFGPYLTTLKPADSVSYFVPNTAESSRVIVQYREFGIKMPLLVTTLDGDIPEHVMKELGDKVLGLRGQAAYIWQRDDPVNKKWVEAMQKRFGRMPGGIENNSYCLTKTILAGLKATKGDDSYAKLWPQVLKVKMASPQGPLSYSPEGVAITDGYIVEGKIINGRYVWDPVKVYPQVVDPRLKK